MFEYLSSTEIFSLGSYTLMADHLLLAVMALIVLIVLFQLLKKHLLPHVYESNEIEPEERIKFSRILRKTYFLVGVLILLTILEFDWDFIDGDTLNINISLICEGLLIIYVARCLDWLISNVLIHRYYKRSSEDRPHYETNNATARKPESSASRIVQNAVYVFAAMLVIQNMGWNFPQTVSFTEKVKLTIGITDILLPIFIFLIARLIVWMITQLVLFGFYQRKKIDVGIQYSLNQLLSYVIYVFAVVIALYSLNIDMTLLWGGGAALLVGVGLGLQETFNDFFSGIVMLFERTVKVNDIIEVEGVIGVVKKIGLRASVVEARNNVTHLIPNSKLAHSQVVNWTFYETKVRFDIQIGVAYGSDTSLVKELLIKATKNNPYLVMHPAPFVRFLNFGDSALEFALFFYSRNHIVIEDIKSDVRFEIDRLFRENDISIPFPQRDVWIKTKPDQDNS